MECLYQGYAAFALGTHSNIFREKREKNITAMKAWFLQHGTSEHKKGFSENMGTEIRNSVEGLEDKAE